MSAQGRTYCCGGWATWRVSVAIWAQAQEALLFFWLTHPPDNLGLEARPELATGTHHDHDVNINTNSFDLCPLPWSRRLCGSRHVALKQHIARCASHLGETFVHPNFVVSSWVRLGLQPGNYIYRRLGE